MARRASSRGTNCSSTAAPWPSRVCLPTRRVPEDYEAVPLRLFEEVWSGIEANPPWKGA